MLKDAGSQWNLSWVSPRCLDTVPLTSAPSSPPGQGGGLSVDPSGVHTDLSSSWEKRRDPGGLPNGSRGNLALSSLSWLSHHSCAITNIIIIFKYLFLPPPWRNSTIFFLSFFPFLVKLILSLSHHKITFENTTFPPPYPFLRKKKISRRTDSQKTRLEGPRERPGLGQLFREG